MDKLTYKNEGETVSIDLGNGYTIIANALYSAEKQKYEVNFYIKDNEVSILDLIEKQEKVEFSTDKVTIKSAILRHVATLLSQGFYDYYTRRYQYMMDCFDKGNSILEDERLNNAG
jgi:hypothetical protein